MRLEGEQLEAVLGLVGRERVLDTAPAVVARLIGHSLRTLDAHLFEEPGAVAERHPDDSIAVAEPTASPEQLEEQLALAQLAIDGLVLTLRGMARRHAWWGPACGPCSCAWHQHARELLPGLTTPYLETEEKAGRLAPATVRALAATAAAGGSSAVRAMVETGGSSG